MDTRDFDALIRTWGSRSRRGSLRLVAGGILAARMSQASLIGEDASAKRRKKKKRKKTCKSDEKKCGGKCISATQCCQAAECASLNTICRVGVCNEGACVPTGRNEGSPCIDVNFPQCSTGQNNCTCMGGNCVN